MLWDMEESSKGSSSKGKRVDRATPQRPKKRFSEMSSEEYREHLMASGDPTAMFDKIIKPVREG